MNVKTLRSAGAVGAIREAVATWRTHGETVAFVPTMGNLHAGHMSLAAQAAGTASRVVMSIFVNPAQFGPAEDFAAYPRTLAEDLRLIEAAATVDLLFVPSVADVYPFGVDDAVRVQLPSLSRELCGAVRPGHFDGVASVVTRLLNIVAPDVLVLGQKDYQQFLLVQRMIADLHLSTELRMGAIVREPDGLAMSSRNRYLSAAERRQAPLLHATLARMATAIRSGRGGRDLGAEASRDLEAAGFRPDYVEVRRRRDLQPVIAAATGDELIVLGAAWLGRTRLIDNLFV